MASFDSRIKRAVVNFSSSGDSTIAAAVAGQSVKVVSLMLTVAGATTLTFKDGVGGTAISGPLPMSANGSIVLDNDPGLAWFLTSAGNGLVLNSSNAVQVSGVVYYAQE